MSGAPGFGLRRGGAAAGAAGAAMIVEDPAAPTHRATARLAIFGAIYATGASYILQIAGLAAGIALARLVDPADFGLLALALTIYEIISRVRLFGLNQIYISLPQPDAADASTHLGLTAGLSFAALLLTLLLAPLLQLFYSSQTILVLIVIALLSLFDSDGLTATPDTILRKAMRYDQITKLEVSSGILAMVAAVAAALAGWGVWALVVRMGTDILLRCAGAWWLAGWRPTAWPVWRKAKRLIQAGVHMWIGSVSGLIGFRYDDFLVGTLFGNQALGYYVRAFDYAKLPMGPLAGVYAVAVPAFARLQNDRQRLSRAYNLFLDSVALFALPASLWLVLVAPEFVEGVIGPKWAPMIPLVQLLIPFAILRPILDGTGGLPVATGRPEIRTKMAVLETGAMLIGGTILIRWLGAPGAALSAGLVVSVSLLGLYVWYLRSAVEIAWRRTFLAPLVGVSAAVAVTLLVGQTFASWPALARLFAKTALFGAGFAGVLLVLHRPVLNELFDLLKAVWNRRHP